MGRKKKEQKENESGESNQVEERKRKRLVFFVSEDVKRNVFGVLFFTLAAILVLGFWGYAGVVGKFLDGLCGRAIGWVKFVFPVFLIMAGIVLLMKKETVFYVSKLIGLILVFLSVTGLMHYFVASERALQMAQSGRGGGYLGYWLAHYFVKYLGTVGGAVIFLALLLLGIIVAFEFSLMDFSGQLKKVFFKKRQTENNSEESEVSLASDLGELSGKDFSDQAHSAPTKEGEFDQDLPTEEDLRNNIGNIKFSEEKLTNWEMDNMETAEEDDEAGQSDEQTGSFRRVAPLKSAVKKRRSSKWIFPSLDILDRAMGRAEGGDIEHQMEVIMHTLRNFGIEVERGEDPKIGPSVTQYSFRPAVGVKIAKIIALQNDLSLALAKTIRIEAPIPGKSLLGIEVPNEKSSLVCLRSALESKAYQERKSHLSLALGQNVSGEYIFAALDKMPHLMIAGSTGTGKSVCINSIIASLLYQNSPEDLKFIMIDPKRVELSLYNGIPHLLTDVVTENSKVVNVLRWAVSEMTERYKFFQKIGTRDILTYREKRKNGEKKICKDEETGELIEEELENIPYIVIIIDELSDLMSSHKRDVEGLIVRIAQMARAVGIHLIVSTQRPSVEVLTGLIKANIGTRIAFRVSQQVDSRTILDRGGAEKLLGRGDMLYVSSESSSKLQRIQGVYLSEREVKDLVKQVVEKNKREIDERMDFSGGNGTVSPVEDNGLASEPGYGVDDQNDELYEAAKKEILTSKRASASFLQRRLRIGYTRAARLLDLLESNGVIGPVNGAKPREIYGSENVLSQEEIEDLSGKDLNEEEAD